MKILILFGGLILAAGFASAAEPVVRIQLGDPIHIQTPVAGTTASSNAVQFSVSVTNISTRSVWFSGYSLDSPSYRLLTRSSTTGQWADYKMTSWCGVGLKLFQLAPGATFTFSVSDPDLHVGRQFGVGMDIEPDPGSKPVVIISDPATVK